MLVCTPYQMLDIKSSLRPLFHTWSGFELRNAPCHCTSIEDTPHTPPDAEARPRNHGKRDVENRTWPRVGNDERRDESVPDPDA